MQIWSYNISQRQKVILEHVNRLLFKEMVSTCSDHDGVHHVGLKAVLIKAFCHGGDQIGTGQHASFQGGWSQISYHSIDLVPHGLCWNRMHCFHTSCILCSDRSNDSGTVNTECMKRFQVRLDSGTTSGITTSDCECYWEIIEAHEYARWRRR